MVSTLIVRLDSLGDVIVTEPLVRAVAAVDGPVTFLAGPSGASAARLLPGVERVWQWLCPWIAPPPAPPVGRLHRLRRVIRRAGFTRAVIATSASQSALPTALMLREAGVPWIGAHSLDYPGALLDVRHRPPSGDVHEVERALDLGVACGYPAPAERRPRLALQPPDAALQTVLGGPPFAVVHPGASAAARTWPADHFRELVKQLSGRLRVVVTGTSVESELCGFVARGDALDLSGALTLNDLAHVLSRAEVLVAGNTGPAHVAAAVGTPVVSLFSPVVPAVRWAPYGVPVRLLGDQNAACRDTRARDCPVPGHPCLASVSASDVARAVQSLLDLPEVA